MSKRRDDTDELEELQDEPVDAPEADAKADDVDEVDDWRDKYLRTLAELDNFRKRTERDREQTRRYALEGLLRDLLPVLDALDYAVQAGGGAEAIREGVTLSLNDARRILADKGLERIDAGKGTPFDPRFHEAVGMLPDPELAPGTVAREERPGYRLHDRVLRPSRVQIVLPPPAPAEPDAESASED